MGAAPERFTASAELLAKHGHRVGAAVPYLMQGDALADALVEAFARLPPGEGHRKLQVALARGIDAVDSPPPELVALFRQLDAVPLWVDFAQLDMGGRTLLRAGWASFLVLMCYALPVAYASPGGNKALVFSGRLIQRATRRLTETGRFLLETCREGGLRRHGPGFKATVMVRVMHAQMRRLLRESGRWRTEAWGAPLNQLDMAGTNLLFSALALEGLRKLGLTFTHEEGEAVMQLWRYSGHLMGLSPELLCATEAEAHRLGELIARTQQPPDEDSRTLVKAVLEAPPVARLRLLSHTRGLLYALARTFLGREKADALGLPDTRWRLAVPFLRLSIRGLEVLRRWVPGLHRLAVGAGQEVWERVLELGLEGRPADFHPPERLRESVAQ